MNEDLESDDLEYQPHITNDPDVWGLLDVAVRRRTDIPHTIYLISGDSASKPQGLLYSRDRFAGKTPSRRGHLFVYQDGGADDGQMLPKGRILPISREVVNAQLPTAAEMVVVWDGAVKSPSMEVVVDGEVFMTEEHSRGLILGDYGRKHDPMGKDVNMLRLPRLEKTPGHKADVDEGAIRTTDTSYREAA